MAFCTYGALVLLDCLEIGHFGLETGVEEALGGLGVGFVVEVLALADSMAAKEEGL